LNLFRKELLVLMKKFWCSSGMTTWASAASPLTMVAWSGHPPPPPFESPPLTQTHDDDEEEEEGEEDDDNDEWSL
jgi:hypothetical protein